MGQYISGTICLGLEKLSIFGIKQNACIMVL